MKSGIGSHGDSEPSRAQTIAVHLLIYVLAFSLAIRIATWFGLLVWVNYAVAVVLLAFWVASAHHRSREHLCLRCMEEVPADAPMQAERRRPLLRFSHFANTAAGVAVLGILLVGPPLVAELRSTEMNPLLAAPGDLWLFTVIYTEWVHHRLRPWCPYCDPWDDEGDPEPAPDPTLFNTRTGR